MRFSHDGAQLIYLTILGILFADDCSLHDERLSVFGVSSINYIDLDRAKNRVPRGDTEYRQPNYCKNIIKVKQLA